MEIDPGDIAAFLALALSAWSMKKTTDFNRRQNEFIDTTDKLNQMLIEQAASESIASRKADISANFVNPATNRYRLKVFNRGKGAARNIRLAVMDDSDLLMDDDIGRKFPVPILEQHQVVELIAAVHMGSPSRVHIKLTWDDDTGMNHEKELHPNW